jgi:signal transduction histidine kinase
VARRTRIAPRATSQAWIAVHPPDLLELVAHELRTPVTSLYGAAQLLDRNAVGAWARTDLVAEMAAESARLVRFLEDLLALADASAGAVHVEPVLVRRVLDAVIARARADHPTAVLRVRGDGAGMVALADAEALRHALGNMLGHAIRSSQDGQVVEVALGCDRTRVFTTVRERLRRPAHEDDLLDRGDVLVEPGGRLWLASAQALVGAMGGELHVTRRGTQRILRLTLRRVVSAED